ncbi:MAG: hypothetical protein ACKVPX_06095 [Myxococcaceae bacterium]
MKITAGDAANQAFRALLAANSKLKDQLLAGAVLGFNTFWTGEVNPFDSNSITIGNAALNEEDKFIVHLEARSPMDETQTRFRLARGNTTVDPKTALARGLNDVENTVVDQHGEVLHRRGIPYVLGGMY